MSRAFVRDHVVRSAEGAIYRVGYIDNRPPATAELHPLRSDGTWDMSQETITLPITELKRVTDPRKRTVPIENLPRTRPRCQRCDKPFRMLTDYRRELPSGRLISRTFIRWSSYRGLFCTLTCALAFAELAHKAGYRIQRKKP